MNVRGIVYKSEDSLFSIKDKHRLNYYYLSKGLVKKFGKFIKKGVYVDFECSEDKMNTNHVNSQRVSYFNEISVRVSKTKKLFYSIEMYHSQISQFVNNLGNICFMDFEFNMHEFYPIKNFVSEIIEAGCIVCKSNLEIIEEFNLFIVPTKQKRITNRTIKFLHYSKKMLYDRVGYDVFYNNLKRIINDYDPHFVVWGKGDIESLRQSFILNNKKPLNFKFMDLSQIHVNYFNLKSTPGLFKTAAGYVNDLDEKQKHNSLEDAHVTRVVFQQFKDKIIK